MSQSVWGYWLIAMGIGVITIMMLVQNYTTINQEDYYLLKEVTQAAMNDSIDYNHYRQYGELKINREKFIENFERRFAETVKGNKNYKTEFYAIYETPPKVSVKVSTNTSSFQVSGDTMDLDVTNSIDAILENNSTSITETFYSIPYNSCLEENKDFLGYCTITNSATLNDARITDYILKKLNDDYNIYGVDERDIEIVSAKYLGPILTEEERLKYIEQFSYTYGDWSEYGHSLDDSQGKTYPDLMANELIDVKLTVADNMLFWSGKYKCDETQGYSPGTEDTLGNDISGQCLLGIKYEIKFTY